MSLPNKHEAEAKQESKAVVTLIDSDHDFLATLTDIDSALHSRLASHSYTALDSCLALASCLFGIDIDLGSPLNEASINSIVIRGKRL
ncbi:unnamed protein product [Gongylonema pulchrum]|uniref:PIN_6 domain-containing protein n=1 Tax=Gongylonema pulchrum TaxID=637853 RepID=A0A183DSD3_9BILA|nr:unnamed protein product [Gongylonema pulchrum]